MPKLAMTDAAIKRTKAPRGQRIEYFDSHPRDRQRGLVLRVSGSGSEGDEVRISRRWFALFRVKGASAKLRRVSIGDYPGTTLAEAREAAAEILKKAKRGIDPKAEEQERQREAKVVAEGAISELAERYLKAMKNLPKKSGKMRRPRYVEETGRYFDNHILPRWGSLNVRKITRLDVGRLRDEVATRGTHTTKDGVPRHFAGGEICANLTFATVRAFFTWAVAEGWIEKNPAAGMNKFAPDRKRERWFLDRELALLWPVLVSQGYPFGHFVRMALLTGQRRDEVVRMEWAEIDFAASVWRIPAARTKSGRSHAVPLSEPALQILEEAKKDVQLRAKALKKDFSRFVFTTTVESPVSGHSHAKREIEKKLHSAVAGLPADKKATLCTDFNEARKSYPDFAPDVIRELPRDYPSWRIHDLRHSVATHLRALGILWDTIRSVLNHAEVGITARYAHEDEKAEIPRRREALDRWAAHLVAVVRVPEDNVVPITRAADLRASA